MSKTRSLLVYTILIFNFITCLFTTVSAQSASSLRKEYALVAFYNVENLFDTLDTPGKDDKEFLPSAESKWSGKRYKTKLAHIADAVSKFDTVMAPNGPAVLGLCEVETKAVVQDLAKTGKLKNGKYQVVFHDGPDERGIDVAFMYQKEKFKLTSYKSHTLTIAGDTSFHTRDQLVVTGKLMGEEIHFIVCHWPSRRGGEEKSEPQRVAAAQLARKIIDSLYTLNANAKIIVMGDLNDDATNKSVKTTLGTVAKTTEASKEKFFNPMEDLFASGKGTLTYKGKWNLFDQFLLSPALVTAPGSKLHFWEAAVFDNELVREKEGKFKGEPWRTYAGTKYLGGYSDHLPVYMYLKKGKR